MKKIFFVVFLVLMLSVTMTGKLVYWHTQEEESRQQIIAQLIESFTI